MKATLLNLLKTTLVERSQYAYSMTSYFSANTFQAIVEKVDYEYLFNYFEEGTKYIVDL
jgi:hypothetical protein